MEISFYLKIDHHCMLGTLIDRPKPSDFSVQGCCSPHVWEQTTYYQPTWCSHCGNLLLGFSRQGYSCKQCIVNVHEGCTTEFNKKVIWTAFDSHRIHLTGSLSTRPRHSPMVHSSSFRLLILSGLINFFTMLCIAKNVNQ